MYFCKNKNKVLKNKFRFIITTCETFVQGTNNLHCKRYKDMYLSKANFDRFSC